MLLKSFMSIFLLLNPILVHGFKITIHVNPTWCWVDTLDKPCPGHSKKEYDTCMFVSQYQYNSCRS